MSGVPGVTGPWTRDEYLVLSAKLAEERASYVAYVDAMRVSFDDFLRTPGHAPTVIALVKAIGGYQDVFQKFHTAQTALQEATRWVEGRVRQA